MTYEIIGRTHYASTFFLLSLSSRDVNINGFILLINYSKISYILFSLRIEIFTLAEKHMMLNKMLVFRLRLTLELTIIVPKFSLIVPKKSRKNILALFASKFYCYLITTITTVNYYNCSSRLILALPLYNEIRGKQFYSTLQ